MRGRICVIPSVNFSVTWWRMVVGTELLHAEHARISEAYSMLKDAWGVLVPTPLFVSESWTGWIKLACS
jgi:hypothetical protein